MYCTSFPNSMLHDCHVGHLKSTLAEYLHHGNWQTSLALFPLKLLLLNSASITILLIITHWDVSSERCIRCYRNTNEVISEQLTREIKEGFVEKEYLHWWRLEEFGFLATPRTGEGLLKTVTDCIIAPNYSLHLPVLFIFF